MIFLEWIFYNFFCDSRKIIIANHHTKINRKTKQQKYWKNWLKNRETTNEIFIYLFNVGFRIISRNFTVFHRCQGILQNSKKIRRFQVHSMDFWKLQAIPENSTDVRALKRILWNLKTLRLILMDYIGFQEIQKYFHGIQRKFSRFKGFDQISNAVKGIQRFWGIRTVFF